MEQERARSTTFAPAPAGYTSVGFDLPLCETKLTRFVSPHPVCAAGRRRPRKAVRADSAHHRPRGWPNGSSTPMRPCAVVGISGGLDSCLALLAAVRACKVLGKPASTIVAITMPCFGTTKRTRSNAEALCEALDVQFGRGQHRRYRQNPLCRYRPAARLLRRDLRKRPGPGAHAGADGLRQQARRVSDRHRRSERTRTRMGDLQRRPYEYVRRQRRRAQNACAPHCAVCGRQLRRQSAASGSA